MRQDRRLKKERWVIQLLSNSGEWVTISEYWINPVYQMSGLPMQPRSLAKCVYHAKMMMERAREILDGDSYQYRLLNTQNEKETIPTEIL